MAQWELACPREPEVKMPLIVRPRTSALPAPPKPREVRTSSGTHLIQRRPPGGDAPQPAASAFTELEVPTGRLGQTQLRNLREVSADPEMTARANAFAAATTPFAMPVPAAAIRPAEEPPEVRGAPVVILSAAASEGPEIEIVGELETTSAFPLVAPTAQDAVAAGAAMPRPSLPLQPRPEHAPAEPVEFAKNVLRHGYLARRLLGLALLVAVVASAAWTATGH